MITRGRYVGGRCPKGKARKLLSAHLKYLEHRACAPEEEREDRAIFTKDADEIERRVALDAIMRQGSAVARYHKLMLSPAQDEPVLDLRDWTRRVMADLEQKKGLRLTWYAVQHRNTNNPHVHIVIAGAGVVPSIEMPLAVRIGRDDFAFLRRVGREHSDREHYREVREIADDLDAMDDPDAMDNQRERRDRSHRDQQRQEEGDCLTTILLPGLNLSVTRQRRHRSEERDEGQRRERGYDER